jgi:hypothetical protein
MLHNILFPLPSVAFLLEGTTHPKEHYLLEELIRNEMDIEIQGCKQNIGQD